MSGKYYFKNIDISNIIDTTGVDVVTHNYIGFPTSTNPMYPIIERPLNIGFIDKSPNAVPVQNATSPNADTNDISNRCKAKPYIYDIVGNYNLSVPSGANYVSVFCVGGAGGGGGGGGGGWDGSNSKSGGDGGTGGAGSYTSVAQLSLTTVNLSPSNVPVNSLNITVGAGGTGGNGGGSANHNTVNGGSNGNSGNPGGQSIFTVNAGTTNYIICTAPGGNAGGGGGSGNSSNNGGSGGNGTTYSGSLGTINSTVLPCNYNASTTNYTTAYPPYTAAGGAFGDGKNNGTGNAGGDGANGYVCVYFLY